MSSSQGTVQFICEGKEGSANSPRKDPESANASQAPLTANPINMEVAA